MSEKKRKRAEKAIETPRKKPATESVAGLETTVAVKHHSKVAQWGPVFVSTPGIKLRGTTSLAPFHSQNDLLLHSSSHPRLSYTATEKKVSEKSPNELCHYLAVFNPSTLSLDVVPSKHLTLRTSVKSEDNEVRLNALRQAAGTNLSARQRLGLEFGSKKAKKAIESLSQNAISPAQVERVLATDKEGRNAAHELLKQNAATNAVIEGISAAGVGALSQEERDMLAGNAQPRPQPNLQAGEAKEVYSTQVLVGNSTLNGIRVKDWVDAVTSGQDVSTPSRFVSYRIERFANAGDLKSLQILRYMLVLIVFHEALRRAGKDAARKLPKPEILKEKLEPFASEALIDTVKKRFSSGGDVSKWNLDNLYAHLTALSLLIDDFITEVSNLAEDLSMTANGITPYFRILGAKVAPPTETQRLKLNKLKSEVKGLKIAQLKLPLDFPKQRKIPVKNRGRGR